jgi:hypothetical protein
MARRCGIYLEDHYFDRTDAAVVFKRVDRKTGKRGTSTMATMDSHALE